MIAAKAVRDYSRVLFASASDENCDKQGRVTIPAKLRDYLLAPEHPEGRGKAAFYTRYGFRRVPYASRISLQGLYAPLHTRFAVELNGQEINFAFVTSRWGTPFWV